MSSLKNQKELVKIDPKDWFTWGKPSKTKPCPCGSGKSYRECCRTERKKALRSSSRTPPSERVKHIGGVERPDGLAGEKVDAAGERHQKYEKLRGEAAAKGLEITSRALKEIEEHASKGLREKSFREQSERLYRICASYETAMRNMLTIPAVDVREK